MRDYQDDITVVIVKADNEANANLIMAKEYKDYWNTFKEIRVDEQEFNNILEVYYGG